MDEADGDRGTEAAAALPNGEIRDADSAPVERYVQLFFAVYFSCPSIRLVPVAYLASRYAWFFCFFLFVGLLLQRLQRVPHLYHQHHDPGTTKQMDPCSHSFSPGCIPFLSTLLYAAGHNTAEVSVTPGCWRLQYRGHEHHPWLFPEGLVILFAHLWQATHLHYTLAVLMVASHAHGHGLGHCNLPDGLFNDRLSSQPCRKLSSISVVSLESGYWLGCIILMVLVCVRQKEPQARCCTYLHPPHGCWLVHGYCLFPDSLALAANPLTLPTYTWALREEDLRLLKTAMDGAPPSRMLAFSTFFPGPFTCLYPCEPIFTPLPHPPTLPITLGFG